jgi:hypothetical protein
VQAPVIEFELDPRKQRPQAQVVVDIGRRTDAYVGVLPRWRRADGRAAVGHGRTVWLDLDTEVAARALEPVEPPPPW